MRVVIAGTHASGKSTLVSDFASVHPEFIVLPDPYEELLDDRFAQPGAGLFTAQLQLSASRLAQLASRSDAIAERGPIDFLAYLHALDALGRPGQYDAAIEVGTALTQRASMHIDLLAVLPLDRRAPIFVDEEEDPALRSAMDSALLDLVSEPELTGPSVVELSGDREERLAQLEAAVRGA